MERVSLIDVSSEDDLLISASPRGFPNRESLGLPENCGENNWITLETKSGQERETPMTIRSQMDQVPELSESPEQKQTISSEINLRKSLAWDNAFFTSEGVLNTEELAIVNSTFRKTESCALSVILEDTMKSTESISTLDSDSWALESIEVDLFENLRASIQRSYGTCNKSSTTINSTRTLKQIQPDAPHIGSSSKVICPSQNKIKTPNVLIRQGASKQQEDNTSKKPHFHAHMAVNNPGVSKSLPKPQKLTSRVSTLATVPSKRRSDSGNIQVKTNAAKALSGNVAKRQSLVFSKEYHTDSGSVTARSFASPKSSGLSLCRVMPSSVSSSSYNNSAGSSSNTEGQSPVEITRRKVDARSVNYSSSGSTSKAPLRTSKSKFGSRNASNSPAGQNSATWSSIVSPASSIDSVASEASSVSNGLKSSNSNGCFSSSSPSCAAPIHVPQPPELPNLPICQSIKNENSGSLLQNQRTTKISSAINVSFQTSGGHHARCIVNNNSGLKCFKPSGLRMPSPKIGYFDAEKTLVQTSNKYSHTGMEINLFKTTGRNNDVGANKIRSSKLQSLGRATQNGTVSCDSQRTPPTNFTSAHGEESASLTSQCLPDTTDITPRVKENQHNQDLSSRSTKGKYLKDFNEAFDKVECGYLPEMNIKVHARQPSAKSLATDLTRRHGSVILYETSVVKCKSTQPSYLLGEEEKKGCIEIDLNPIAKSKSFEKENLLPGDQTGGLFQQFKSENLAMATVEFMEQRVSYLRLHETKEFNTDGD